MPDVIEMPYRPPLQNAGLPGEKNVTCRLGGRTCLAGDIIGDYSFEHMPQVGDRLTFSDMAIYTMVKTNTFNGMPLPAIALEHEDDACELVKAFGYEDFKGRLS
jgi:carboxynorspermidine decarboxylase